MSYAERLETLIRLAETGLREEDPKALLEEIKASQVATTASDLGSDLEIVFRELLDRLLKSNHVFSILPPTSLSPALADFVCR
jgi:hypothetical protein